MFTLDLCTVTWITISALATLAIVIISFVVLIRPTFRRPKFSIQYGEGEPFCRQTQSYRFGRSDTVVKTYWTRLRITNSGRSLAGHCLGKLTRVLKENGQENKGFDPIQLHWVGTNWDDVPFRSVDLNRGNYEYLDVVVTQFNDSEAYFAGDQLPWAKYEERQILDHVSPGKHILGITIYGDDVKPETKYLSLIWRGGDIADMSVELHGSLRKAKSWLKKKAITSADGQAKLDTSRHEPRNDLIGRYFMSQTLTYYILGLILVFLCALPLGFLSRLFCGFLAVIAILWAFGVCMVAFNCNLPKKLEWVRWITEFIRRWNEPIYWFAAVTVFSVGFIMTLVDLHIEGIAAPFLYSFYALWFILLVLNVLFIRRQQARGSRTV